MEDGGGHLEVFIFHQDNIFRISKNKKENEITTHYISRDIEHEQSQHHFPGVSCPGQSPAPDWVSQHQAPSQHSGLVLEYLTQELRIFY